MLKAWTLNEKLAALLGVAVFLSTAMTGLGKITTRFVCEAPPEGGLPFLIAGFGFLFGTDSGAAFGTTAAG